MGRGLLSSKGALIGSILIVLIMVGGVVTVDVHPNLFLMERAALPLSMNASTVWHDGTDQSTPEVSVSYSDEYSLISNGQQDCLSRYMWLTYNDGTGARVGFELHCAFELGGLDIANQTVLDWNKLIGVELILHSEG